ncbi:MAG: Gfo/Idh/MocA family oxidoreductase [Chloroflexi bacterium]|nr:Gfo/Idh/MocA family oxidoreductase [Chloroflexota bacterium]MYG90281.1 Gfo/Idh/MocA family oxidoreductase [Chloroflexota bacterium]MYJ93812.1 Gfo/Idh/MocA family oxidoreductase [Chloroflexota bacterium]
MTTNEPKRVGVFGTGWGTRVSVPAFRAAGWEVAALWSRKPERAAMMAQRLEIPFATHEASALLDRPEIDAVAIHTPPHMHLDLCRAAFAAGKHVLVDKPFATNVDDARQLAAAAENSSLTAMVNYEFRYAPLRARVAELLQQGAIGEVRHASIDLHMTNPMIQMDRPWRLDPAHGGGLLNEMGSHAIDRFRQWFGDIASVSAQFASFPPEGLDPSFTTEDQVNASFTFDSGASAALSMSWVSDPPLGLHIVITGSDGVILAISPGSMLSEGEVKIGKAGDSQLTALQAPAQDSEDLPADAVGTSARLIQAFATGIETGNSPAPNFTDGLHSQIAIDAMRESASAGQVLPIERE